ncbi:lantibiotic dehydratase family protein [Chryseobacterium potabilaquae]|uniref:Nisin biosynthesis protein NisB n=1 Tax=Chryseobacterium potabilaquae TaxID=2675057 RepID=A0A6N4X6T6_9FLAO|nr:lantibiotic dehydratase family protein [Chryseobacterium potabilaquae]CAA7196414.1 Nisin biosynthesis protein NisB [Chryseobacterium potabilaquae]
MSYFPYHFFDEYVARTSLLSYKSFKERLGKDEISEVEIKEIFQNPIFKEAIYLASPYFYSELENWLLNKEFSSKEYQKLANTLLKYYSRMSTRCTPFGLFSAVGVGDFRNEINKTEDISFIRDTKLDMHFLVSLSDHFVKIPEVRNRLLFYPNNSIYIIRNKIRYVEYEYAYGKREYIISSVPLSEELQRILTFSKQGKNIEQITNSIINEEITKEEAIEFIEELIDNQVLVSELEPNVSGDDFLNTIISVLEKVEIHYEKNILISIQNQLKELDQNIGNFASAYKEIEKLIEALFISKVSSVEYDQKYLFQTDLYSEDKFEISSYWKKELKKGISFLNKITLSRKDTHLEKFKKAFYERFETQEVSLSYVLDTEIGIGYRQDIMTKGLHPYLEDLDLPLSHKKSSISMELDPIQQIINEKLQEALLQNQYTIELHADDFEEFEENWNDIPDTISFMAEIISEVQQEKLFLDGGGGSSAACLLGRFCSEKSEVQNLTQMIARKEEELNPEYILAEVIHLPEARLGNVIRRPTLRQYEIPYLAQSILPEENQITIDDLYISLKNDKIILRSKRLNKEIRPYLTNAHNYFGNSLPVYHFLCDLNSQNIRSGLYFNWGDLKNIYQFLPRIEYKNIILSKASWKITEKDLIQSSILMHYEKDNKEQLLSELRIWRNKRQVPQWIQWVQSDNKLTLNLENYDLVKIFIDTIKKLKIIVIEEFLYNENSDFMHQFIFSMYNEKKWKEKC